MATQTFFGESLLKQIHRQITFGHMSFTACSEMNNDEFDMVTPKVFEKLQCFVRKATNPWHMNELRAEEAWFTLKTVEYAAKHELTDMLNVAFDVKGCRRDLEDMCNETLNWINQMPDEVSKLIYL